MTNEQKHDLFDRYHFNSMDAREKAEFESLLAKDPLLSEEFTAFEKTVGLINVAGVRDEISLVMQAEPVRSRRLSVWIWSAAASVILGTFLYSYFRPRDTDELFQTWYHPYPNVVTVRSSLSANKAMEAYSAGDFREALEGLQQATRRSDTVLFYEGICYLSLSKSREALRSFEQVPVTSAFIQQSRWYSGLASLQSGDKAAARVCFRQIAENEFHFPESRKLIRDLE